MFATTYKADRLEVLVVDGMSVDETRSIIAEIARNEPRLRLVDNPQGSTPSALNIGIRASSGEIVIRLDAHATYPPTYFEDCVQALIATGADNVGGLLRIVPRDSSLLGRAIVAVEGHRFGVGNSQHRVLRGGPPVIADTVPFFCMRRDTLNAIGPFNELLTRGQDMEYALRLKRAGRVIMLCPNIECFYSTRTDWRLFIGHNYTNGKWAVIPFFLSDDTPVALRHLVPMAFVVTLIIGASFGLFSIWGRWLFAVTVVAYSIACALACVDLSVRLSRGVSLLPVMPVVFIGLHLSYGLGSVVGLVVGTRYRRPKASTPS